MKFNKVIAAVAGLGAIFIALVLVDAVQPQPTETVAKLENNPPVSVISVTPTDYSPSLELLATTSARWPTQVRSSSSAQLEWINPVAEPGTLVKQGTLLARLNSSYLTAQKAQAQSELKQAELNLHQQQYEQQVTLKMLPPEQNSAFARREPQVAAAEAELARARQSLSSAEKVLAEAEIVAPFDAILVHRHVSPGEWLSTGQPLFDMAASDSLDVVVPVSEMHWQQLSRGSVEGDFVVLDRQGNQWPAQLRFISPQLDPSTRQRQLALAVNQPFSGEQQLSINQQVKIRFNLPSQQGLAKLPLSSITRDGYVWTLDTGNKLQQEWVNIVEQQAETAYVSFQSMPMSERQVVAYPLISMLPGKQVEPQPVADLVAKLEAK